MPIRSADHEMHAFCRIVETGSFAAAAVDLALTPSAISKLISRLENRLGVMLLTRTTRRLSLTAEGEIYLRRARAILDAIDDTEMELMRTAKAPSGNLRISVGTAFGRHVLIPVLPDFLARYPKISIELGITERHVDLVAEQIDVAIRTGPLSDSVLLSRKIGTSDRVICASRAYLAKFGIPRTPADLAQHNCISISGFAHLRFWPFATPEGVNRMEIAGNFNSDNADAVRDMAVSGLGIARLARFLVAREIERGDLIPILTEIHSADPFPVTALMPPGGNRSPKVRAFVDFLIETFSGDSVS